MKSFLFAAKWPVSSFCFRLHFLLWSSGLGELIDILFGLIRTILSILTEVFESMIGSKDHNRPVESPYEPPTPLGFVTPIKPSTSDLVRDNHNSTAMKPGEVVEKKKAA
ncbi:hypothetical protein M3Y94_00744300 [Aphelenchoides besseyi]|nr:hypothetical protein M3Y94_00744300 [Aphelenchoides besseyi]